MIDCESRHTMNERFGWGKGAKWGAKQQTEALCWSAFGGRLSSRIEAIVIYVCLSFNYLPRVDDTLTPTTTSLMWWAILNGRDDFSLFRLEIDNIVNVALWTAFQSGHWAAIHQQSFYFCYHFWSHFWFNFWSHFWFFASLRSIEASDRPLEIDSNL